MNAAQLFVKCPENEGVEYIFGVLGEENLEVMDALIDSSIRFITTRHEQGAAFMADVYGRLTGRAGVCLSTLGPGATNLVTGVADANMDHAPVVAIAGQAGTNRLHKESHQVLDLEHMFRPITKYSSRLLNPDVARFPVVAKPLTVNQPFPPEPPQEQVERAARLISEARNPMILAGNGVVRAGAWKHLADFAEQLNIPVANTFMAKGVTPFRNRTTLASAGLQANDYVSCGFSRADVIICVGYDLVEYHPHLWHPTRDRSIIHIDRTQAEVDEHYTVTVGVLGDLKHSLMRIAALTTHTRDI